MKNLIAISGKKGSGKDTVGCIIQYLTTDWEKHFYSPKQKILPFEETMLATDRHLDSPWKVKKFAGKVKQIASLLTGIPVEKFEDQEFKNQPMGEEWDYTVWQVRTNHNILVTHNYKEDALGDLEHFKEYYIESDVYLASKDIIMTPRLFLQLLGTDACRNNVHPEIWVNATFADYIGVYKHTTEHNSHWLITDCRFPNEAKAVKDRGGIIVRVNRDTNSNDTHISENALNDCKFDYVIENNGAIEELIEEVRKMLVHYKII